MQIKRLSATIEPNDETYSVRLTIRVDTRELEDYESINVPKDDFISQYDVLFDRLKETLRRRFLS